MHLADAFIQSDLQCIQCSTTEPQEHGLIIYNKYLTINYTKNAYRHAFLI